MQELFSVLRGAELVVNDLVGEIDSGEANLEQAERRVVVFVNASAEFLPPRFSHE